jgi:hypothetical protein
MHAERKKKQNKLKDGDNDGAGLQIDTPQTGILRLAWWVVEIRPPAENTLYSRGWLFPIP